MSGASKHWETVVRARPNTWVRIGTYASPASATAAKIHFEQTRDAFDFKRLGYALYAYHPVFPKVA